MKIHRLFYNGKRKDKLGIPKGKFVIVCDYQEARSLLTAEDYIYGSVYGNIRHRIIIRSLREAIFGSSDFGSFNKY